VILKKILDNGFLGDIMNKKILKLITDVIATRFAEVLDLIDPEWDKKARQFEGEWKDFGFNLIYEKLTEEK